MSRKKRLILTGVLLAALVVMDQATKWVAIQYLRESGQVYSYWGGLFRFQYAENTGAFLSLGAGWPDGIRAAVMIGVNSLILAAVLAYLLAATHLPCLPALALACIAGGGIGNLIDRLFRDGRVIDFMNMGVNLGSFSLRTGIFNVADVAIMAGLFLIIFNELFALRGNAAASKKQRAPEK